jgi:hypothetical protein
MRQQQLCQPRLLQQELCERLESVATQAAIQRERPQVAQLLLLAAAAPAAAAAADKVAAAGGPYELPQGQQQLTVAAELQMQLAEVWETSWQARKLLHAAALEV